MTAVNALMSTYAMRNGLTAPHRLEEIRENRKIGLIVCGVFLVSIPIAFVAPQVAPWLWLTLFFVRVRPTPR